MNLFLNHYWNWGLLFEWVSTTSCVRAYDLSNKLNAYNHTITSNIFTRSNLCLYDYINTVHNTTTLTTTFTDTLTIEDDYSLNFVTLWVTQDPISILKIDKVANFVEFIRIVINLISEYMCSVRFSTFSTLLFLILVQFDPILKLHFSS